MFESLKKKFSSWLGKEEPKKATKKAKKKEEKKSKPVKAKAEPKKPKKPEKVKRTKPSKEQVKEERQITEKLMQDIKKEGIDTTAPEIKVDQAIKEIKEEEKILEEESKIEEENIELELKEENKEKGKKSWWPFGKKKETQVEKAEEEKVLEEESKIEEENEEVEEKKESFFSKLVNKLQTSKLNEQEFDDIFYELEITLLENNTSLDTVDKIKESLKTSLVNKEIKKSEIEKTIIDALKNSILSVLIEPPDLIEKIKQKKENDPFVILFFGINGSGKTTSIAKLAHLLKNKGISCVLAAADTFRAASIEQLETHANRIKVPIVKSNYGSDPASVAFDAISYAKAHKIKVVLIDTAGRMYTKSNLMKEMEKIVRISKPDLKFFVGESITGNDATEQAKTFNESVGIDGIVLSKADVDEKAGTILSVSQVTGKPIYFLGTGQGYDNLTPFTKSTVLKNLGLE